MASLFGVQAVFKTISKNKNLMCELVLKTCASDSWAWPRCSLHKTCASLQKRYKLKTSNTFAISFQYVLRCPADVSFADKCLKHVSQTSSSPKLTKDVIVTKTYGSLGRDIIRSSRSRFSIWDDVTRAYTFWCVHLEPIRSVVTRYDCGQDVFQFPRQGYPRFELRLDLKGIYTARLTFDFNVSFKISYDWNQDLIWADTRAAISPR